MPTASAIFEKFIPSDRSRRIVSTASGVIGRAGDLERRRETANGVRLPVKQLAKASGLSIGPPRFDPHQDLVTDGFDARRQRLRRDGFAADPQLLAAVLDELVLLVAGG
ncbi:hypothetical protein [Sinorhizobium medicae]|uniref:hypothetical protein n=1 Tax=Sinorhizobium medicae TaxID=110321 RepID=UPI0012DED364|nr:hypothetical protein [Sinorhizobium medicae]